MAQLAEKTGRQSMSELSHTMTFLTSMGYTTETLSVADALDLKSALLEAATKQLGEPTNEVRDAF